ncbi:MAG: N-acetylneuraminate synthase family protein [Rhodocyclales bacterium]|nr:N-acetylneuraminate synthase family protein [Rhodocyclales bacterium]
MKIGDIDLSSEVLVIAEIGNNHEGDYGLAVEMVQAAAVAGAHAVKFQTIEPVRLVSALQAARIEQLGRFAFSRDQFEALSEVARNAGVMFMSTPFSPEVVPWLNAIVPAFKIASGDNNYGRLLTAIAATGKPILLSTGMTDLDGIGSACQIIEEAARAQGLRSEIALLHCVSAYPTPPDQANLRAIAALARETGRVVGYSDHTLGIDAAVLSIALGARIVEKHFTLSKTQSDFRDHALSADPAELAELVRKIALAQAMLGTGEKTLQPAETQTAAAARRSIVARVGLPIGHILVDSDLEWLRPGGGLLPGQEGLILGRRLTRPAARGEMILPDMVA